MNALRRFLTDRRGASVVEYGMLLCLVALLVILVFASFGPSLSQAFGAVATSV